MVKPELAELLNAAVQRGAPETNRLDIVLAVLQGLPGLNQQSGRSRSTRSRSTSAFRRRPTRTASACSVATCAGYPNGRRLTDDVVDIAFQVVAGELADPKVLGADACKAPAKCPNPTDLGDGVPANDKPFSSTFPYLVAARLRIRLDDQEGLRR